MKASSPEMTAGTMNNSGLEPYLGPWTRHQAAHLLRRTTYGAKQSVIDEVLQNGLEQTIDLLFESLPLPEPPINPSFEDDPDVPIGSTWVDKPLSKANLKGHRRQSLHAWTLLLASKIHLSIREKLFMFWHNHFVISDIQDPRFVYEYSQLLRKHAMGNFKTLTKEVTIEPAMLRYLNGNQNTRFNPNENYARELLELFTIGKGPAAGPGDYTNYTEDDVLEIAKVLTGWVDRGFNSVRENYMPQSLYRDNRHDKSEKKLSHRFGNIEISNQGAKEYDYLIDIIFQQKEVGRFISRKLYRWFVNHEISAEIETQIIEPMAEMLIQSDFEIAPALKSLLGSQHFYQETFIGAIIKSPIDHLLQMIKTLEIDLSQSNIRRSYNIGRFMYRLSDSMQQATYYPPDVAGWKAYYQEPVYYQNWISSSTLQYRQILAEAVVNGKFFNGTRTVNNNLLRVDILKWTDQFEDALNPNRLIQEMSSRLFPQPITDDQIVALKDVLLPGLPDYEWTIEYGDYLSDPTNKDLSASIENKLRALMSAMVAMPEFYLM